MGQCWKVSHAVHYSTGKNDRDAINNLIMNIQQKGGYTEVQLHLTPHLKFTHEGKTFIDSIRVNKKGNRFYVENDSDFPGLIGEGTAEIGAIADLMYQMEEDEGCSDISEYYTYKITYIYEGLKTTHDVVINCNNGLWYTYIFK